MENFTEYAPGVGSNWNSMKSGGLWIRDGETAIVSCPTCAKTQNLSQHTVVPTGEVDPELECSGCGWFALLLILLLSGCTLRDVPFLGRLVTSDLDAFQTLALKHGTPQDQSCSKLLADHWRKMGELLADDSGALVAFAYRGILAHRMVRAAEGEMTQQCGQFAAEIAVMIGQMSGR